MNVKKVETAEANEESNFTARFVDAILQKGIILPVIGALLLIVFVWALMTKCGRKPCCKDIAVSR